MNEDKQMRSQRHKKESGTVDDIQTSEMDFWDVDSGQAETSDISKEEPDQTTTASRAGRATSTQDRKPPAPEPIKKNRSALPVVIILAAIVLVIGGGLFFYQHGISPVNSKDSTKIYITVEQGSGGSVVLAQLEEKGLVKSTLCGKIYLKLSAPGGIQANTYVFTKKMSLSEMYNAMEKGDPKYLERAKITVIEGGTIPQLAEDISKEYGIPAKEIINKWKDPTYLQELISTYWFLSDDILNKELLYPLEGYFYPETYYVGSENPTVEDITTLMLDMMDKKLTPYKNEIQSKMNMSVHEFLSFTSVVEAESLFDVDRPKIAGVFVNRLKEDMPLQSDITVLYVLQEKRPNVSIAETKTKSPYNTYMNKGVPIGPVCTVQEATVKDCLNYTKSDYLYFFATKDGKVLYSKTFAEHDKTVKENKWY